MLDFLNTLTTIIAPILALLLAILSTFADTRHEVEIKDNDIIRKKKVLTPWGKLLLALMIVAASLTLSGKFVEQQQKSISEKEQVKLDSLNQVKRDSILGLAERTLASAEEIKGYLTSQAKEMQKEKFPLFPMIIELKMSKTFSQNDEIIRVSNQLLRQKQNLEKSINQKVYTFKKQLTIYNIELTGIIKDSALEKLLKLVQDEFHLSFLEVLIANGKDIRYSQKINFNVGASVAKDVSLNLFINSDPEYPTISIEWECRSPYIVENGNSQSWLDFRETFVHVDRTYDRGLKEVEFLSGPQGNLRTGIFFSRRDTLNKYYFKAFKYSIWRN